MSEVESFPFTQLVTKNFAERGMSPFETDGVYTKRKETGSRFSFNGAPPELSKYRCFYENPIYGLDIGFSPIFVSEEFALKSKKSGHLIQQPICTGLILERGGLKKAIEANRSSSVSPSVIDYIINDIYELMVERAINSNFYDLREAGIKIHIYEADARQFNEALWDTPDNFQPGLDMISKLQAKLVF